MSIVGARKRAGSGEGVSLCPVPRPNRKQILERKRDMTENQVGFKRAFSSCPKEELTPGSLPGTEAALRSSQKPDSTDLGQAHSEAPGRGHPFLLVSVYCSHPMLSLQTGTVQMSTLPGTGGHLFSLHVFLILILLPSPPPFVLLDHNEASQK